MTYSQHSKMFEYVWNKWKFVFITTHPANLKCWRILLSVFFIRANVPHTFTAQNFEETTKKKYYPINVITSLKSRGTTKHDAEISEWWKKRRIFVFCYSTLLSYPRKVDGKVSVYLKIVLKFLLENAEIRYSIINQFQNKYSFSM